MDILCWPTFTRPRAQWRKLKDDLRVAIDGNPRKVVNYVALESIYENEGDWEGAKKLCERAREIDPDSPSWRIILRSLP